MTTLARLPAVVLLAFAAALPAQAPGNSADRYFDLSYTMGYRFVDVGGSRDRFATDYDLDEGFRLSELRLEGHFESMTRFPDRILIDSENLADPYERHRIEIEKTGSYRAGAVLKRSRYQYRASGDFHRVDRESRSAAYDLSVPLGDFEVFAGFERTHVEGFWLTNRIGDRNLTPLYSITNVASPRRINEDEGELGLTFHHGATSLTVAGEYLDQDEDNRWTYSQPAVGNPAFLETENTSSGSALEGPGARFDLDQRAGALEVSLGGRYLDRRRRIVGAGTATGFDTNQYTTTTRSLSNGSARTLLLDGELTYELGDTVSFVSGLRYLDHKEHLFIDQTDVTVYPALSSSVTVNDRRDQRTVSRLREASAELDWLAAPGLTLTGGWGWSQEKLRVPDLEAGDADFRRGTVVEDGFIVAALWKPDEHWKVRARYRDFGQGGLQMHEIADHETRGVRGSVGYRKDTLWCDVSIDHHRSANPVSGSRTERTAYTASGGYAPDSDFDWHGSYTFADTDSRTLSNFYFDPSPTPVATLVGFHGESHTIHTDLDWRIGPAVQAALFGNYTTVQGDFELDLYNWGADLALLLPAGRVGIRVEQVDYHESGNPDDYDVWMAYLYMSARLTVRPGR